MIQDKSVSKKNQEKPGDKFFFHLNVFDDDLDLKAKEDPPPPTFSEDELSAAKQIAFSEGRKMEAQEQQKSREKYIAGQMEIIAKHIGALHATEQARSKQFEKEAIELTICIFQKLFPLLQQHIGIDQLKESIESIIKNQESQKTINVFVHPADLDEISAHVAVLKAKGHTEESIRVEADEALTPGSCRIGWAHGGAIKNPATVAEEIHARLQQVLAGQAANSHDGS